MTDWVSSRSRRLRSSPRESDVAAETPEPIPGSDGLRPVTDDDVGLDILQWSVWHMAMKVRFELVAGERGCPTHAIFYFGCCATEVALEPADSKSLMRKIGEATVDWPVYMADLDVGDYPA
ncbi:MAG TPA: hypothetical protein VGZ52_02065 [Acidimicrobiales bacterium]|jgi:hypothetical protein|nr:hypothetical protein [Acidimicrobiales bacterium]